MAKGTPKQIKIKTITQWLEVRGGRTVEDLEINEKRGFFVFMGNGFGKMKKVFVPKRLQDDTLITK